MSEIKAKLKGIFYPKKDHYLTSKYERGSDHSAKHRFWGLIEFIQTFFQPVEEATRKIIEEEVSGKDNSTQHTWWSLLEFLTQLFPVLTQHTQ